MQEKPINKRRRNPELATRVKRTAEICGVSTRTVRRVIIGDSVDEQILSVFMKLQDGENKLIKAVKKAVPFN